MGAGVQREMVNIGASGPSGVRIRRAMATALAILFLASGCAYVGDSTSESVDGAADAVLDAEAKARSAALAARAFSSFGPLPSSVPNLQNVGIPAKIDLGRMLYYDKRLSKNHDISCNSCHMLDAFGVDGEPTSPGHRGQRGGRNSPTVFNAATHIAQFWDGREPDVEAQAKGPILNPIEMAAPSEAYIVDVLSSIPGYVTAFHSAFPAETNPLTYDNMARAIGAFERELTTPGRFDSFMTGDLTALNAVEQRGLDTFLTVGCHTCHIGAAVGGTQYRKLGMVFPYETADLGREDVTGNEADRHVFKVPALRNVAETGPYFHDGSITDLSEVVRIMAYHQLGQTLSDAQVSDVVAFLGSLTGEVDADYVAIPVLPESGPNTPAPDPS
jgi:cytochrome c peroxidase